MDASDLYWPSFKAVYQQLQAANRSTADELSVQLNLSFKWLLDGFSRFEKPNDSSRHALKAEKSLKASAWGPKRGIVVDKHLVDATVELSQLLDLDELQCHLLLKRWLKDNDVHIQPPTAAPSSATPAGGPLLALPAPPTAATTASPGSTSTASAGGQGQAVLPADVVQGVADYYAQERLYLNKCQQYIVMTAMNVRADSSQTCRNILRRLLDGGWETKTFDSLSEMLAPQQTAAEAAELAPAVQAPTGRDPALVVRPYDFEQRLHLHTLHERCELLSLLTQLYCGPDPICSRSSYSLQQLLREREQQQDMFSETEADDIAAVAAAVAEVAGLSWPECSEERLIKLLKLLGDAVFLPGTSNGFTKLRRRTTPPAPGSATDNQAANFDQLAQALASSLIVAALKPAQLLNRLAESAIAASAGGPLPRNTTTFKQWRSIEAALMQWRVVPGCVLPMLAVFAYNQLLASYRGCADAMSPSIQQTALQAGGFAAIAAPLSLEELSPNSLAGSLHRGLLLQSVSLMASAFDLSPMLLPGLLLQQLIEAIVNTVKGCPHLTQQVWDSTNVAFKPLRYLLDEACSLFPAFPGPFLQLATGLSQDQVSAAACYSYLCSKPCLTVEYEANTPGVELQGEEAVLDVDMPWAKAPDVEGSILPQGTRGRLLQVPMFAQPPTATEGGAAPPTPFLVAWEVDAEQGTGPVLLLARAAHCLQQLHVMNTERQDVAGTEAWQDLRLILQLVAALLKADPLFAKPLLNVNIVYNRNQQMDWLDVVIASLNVLPTLTVAAGGLSGTAVPAASKPSVHNRSSDSAAFCREVLAALADSLTAAAAVASCQPSRVMGALAACQLFVGAAQSVEPLGLVPLEQLSAWAQEQQQRRDQSSVDLGGDWSALTNLQALQEAVEVPHSSYPLTHAVIHLVQTLLNQHCTYGLVSSLVFYTLNRVLGAMPWIPFTCTSDRWSLASAALSVVRSAILSSAVATPGAAGPKAAGAAGGIMVTAVAARVIHHLATAGHGYLSSVLPPPADILQDMAEQQAGSSELLAAGTDLAEQLLLLVSVVLPAVAHLSPEMPLQQYWGTSPPGGGLSPAAIIASYATYPYATHLPLLALEALNAFAILQTGAAAASSGGFTAVPSAGGPPVPAGGIYAAGVGPVQGPVQQGLNPAQPYLRGVHVATAAGMGVGGRGGAGGWWRPTGLFSGLFTALPNLKAALLRPFELSFAQEYPELTIRSMALLEAGVRFHPEILDTMCFPSALKLPDDQPDLTSTTAAANKSPSKPYSVLDGLWQMLKQVSTLMDSQVKLLAAAMRLLSTLWECQGPAHGAVELLRSQPGFWGALKACLPTPGALPVAEAGADPSESEAVAWKLQVHTCALHILLLELLSIQVPKAATAVAPPASSSSSSGLDSLLLALGPLEVSKLMLACSDVGVQQHLVDQLARLLQVTYLQLGGSAVTSAWGPATLKSDTLSVATQFRREVQPLLEAAAAGQYSLADLQVACCILADPERAEELTEASVAQQQLGGDDEIMEGDPQDIDTDHQIGVHGVRGRVLVDALTARPFGEVLLSFSAVTPGSWAAGETEYGREFLYDSSRLRQLLGPFILQNTEGARALAVTLEDVSVGAAVAHARLSLLQAATSLFASLSRHAPARRQLMLADVCKSLLQTSLKAVDTAISEAIQLTTSPASRLLTLPWGLPFLSHASSTAVLLASRSLLLCVKVWKIAISSAAAAGEPGSSSSSGVRPVLLARSLNGQTPPPAAAGGGKQQQQGSGLSGGFSNSAAIAAAAQCASLLGQWLRGRGADSLAPAAADSAAAADVETISCLSTSLLLLLQALPAQRYKVAAARGKAAATAVSPSSSRSGAAAAKTAAGENDKVSNNMMPAEILELEAALLDLLPALCNACAVSVDQQQQQQAAAAADPVQYSHASAMLQLLIEILQHQLPPTLWLAAVSQHLALVPLLAAAAARSGSSSSSEVTESVAAAAAVTDISVLELTLAVAQAPEGALQLWQQGLIDVLLGFCRSLMHTRQDQGLLDAASLGLVGPSVGTGAPAGVYHSSAAAGFSGLDLNKPSHLGMSLSTIGAYVATSSSSSSSSVQTIAGLPTAASAAAAAAAGSSGSGIWSPRHQQWCLLLGLCSTLLQQLSKSTPVEDIAMQVFVAAEPRLMVALQRISSSSSSSSGWGQQQHQAAAAAGTLPNTYPHGVLSLAWGPEIGTLEGFGSPGSSSSSRFQPPPVLLTLGNLLESERALYLLGLMVPHVGVWQLQRPGSLAAFRRAAASFVEFVAAPSLERSFQVVCSPLSPFECRLARLPSGVEASDGWFKTFSAGGANNLADAAAAAAGSAAAGGSSSALAITTAASVGPTSPRVGLGGSSPRSGSAGDPAAAAGSGGSGSLIGPSGVGGCSEYCTRLCEAMYTACEHGLGFLLATAPVVEAGEVAAAAAAVRGEGLGPVWPSAKALGALQDQVLAVGTSMVQHPQSLTARRRGVATLCVRIAAAAGQLLEAVLPSQLTAVRSRAGVDGAADLARRREKMLQIQRGVCQG